MVTCGTLHASGQEMTTEHRLEELADRVFRELGFAPTDLLRQRLDRVVRQRIKLAGFTDLDSYLNYLGGAGGEEFTRLVQALTINETYFFREPRHFAALERLLPGLAARARPVRILSAGCASGEEAYSLAITACRTLGEPGAFEVVGVDVDEGALSRAREGVYGGWSFREDALKSAGDFLKAEGDTWRVVPEIKGRVRFERMNLVESAPAGPFHVVFCRNLLMYLTPENRRAVVDRLARELAPGGVLFTGSAESLEWSLPDLKRVRAHGTFFYEKQALRAVPGPKMASARSGRLVLVSPSPLVRMLWRQAARAAGTDGMVILADGRRLYEAVREYKPELVVVDATTGDEEAAAALLQGLPGRCRRVILTRPGRAPSGQYPRLEVVAPGSGGLADLQAWLEGFLGAARGAEGGAPPAAAPAPPARLLLIGCSTGGRSLSGRPGCCNIIRDVQGTGLAGRPDFVGPPQAVA